MSFVPGVDPDSQIQIHPEELMNELAADIARLSTENASLRLVNAALREQRDEYASQLAAIIPPLPDDA